MISTIKPKKCFLNVCNLHWNLLPIDYGIADEIVAHV